MFCKKMLFITAWDFGDGPSAGITKKIKSQIKGFESYNFCVDYVYIEDDKAIINKANIEAGDNSVRENIVLGRVGNARKFALYFYLYRYLIKNNSINAKTYDIIYSRYALADYFYNKILKLFRDNSKKVFVEIPTYPYDEEKRVGLAWDILYGIDKCYRRFIKKYVDKIITYGQYKSIFGVDVIKTDNGIDFDTVTIHDIKQDDDGIHLIAVAGLAKWHGYDRMLYGLGNYYNDNPVRKVYFHIVGDGPVRKDYERIVNSLNITKYVEFCGVLNGKELDSIYNRCSIGIENLGFHRLGVYDSSSLKSREYGAKGLPFVTSCVIEGFENAPFILNCPPDESAMDISRIVEFYDNYANKADPQSIRDYSFKRCSMYATLKPIVDEMLI